MVVGQPGPGRRAVVGAPDTLNYLSSGCYLSFGPIGERYLWACRSGRARLSHFVDMWAMPDAKYDERGITCKRGGCVYSGPLDSDLNAPRRADSGQLFLSQSKNTSRNFSRNPKDSSRNSF